MMRAAAGFRRRSALRLGLFLLCCMALSLPAATAPAKLDIHEIRLDNGLRIFVLERSTSPTFAAYYQFGVGGASDPKGRSGIAHLLEHMMFKGTRSIGTLDAGREERLMQRLSVLWHDLDRELARAEDPFAPRDSTRIRQLRQEIDRVTDEQKQLVLKNEYDEIVTRAGGVGANASTSLDHTNYFVQLPSNRLELWFRLESDRLQHPIFREFWSERDVVHEERRMRYENQAEGRVGEALSNLLYQAHPYGTPVIGWPRDIANLKQEDAEQYFRTYYSPSNCIMALVGDVRTADVERLARKHLSGWKRQELAPLDITAEPEQKGERRAVVEFEAQPVLAMAWPTVPEGNADAYALDVLASVLGGLSSSRLDRALVLEQRLASRVGSSHPTQRWSGSLRVSAYPNAGHTTAELESAVETEIRKIQDGGVTAEELERAKVQTEAARVRSLKSNSGQAMQIGIAVGISGGTAYIHEYEERLNAVTAEQVQSVAKQYLQPSRRCVVEVRNVPGAGKPAPGGDTAEHRGGSVGERGAKHSSGFLQAMMMVQNGKPLDLRVPEIGKDVERVVLPSGVTVFVKEDHSAPSIDLSFAWLGGSRTMPVEQLTPFSVASALMTQGGTEKLAPIAVEERMEQLGMSFGVSVGATSGGADFWSLSRNFPESFALAMDMLMRPRFDPERLEVIKGQVMDDMRRRYDYPSRGASVLRTYVLYHDHPRLGWQPTREGIEKVTPDDVRRIWRRYLGRDNMYVTAVGDFDRRQMLDLLERTFAPWQTAEDKRRDFLPREPAIRPGLYLVEKEVSSPAIVLTHQVHVDRTLPLQDHAAIEILNDILGGSGFRSRLMERLRSDEGLTYGIYSGFNHQGRPGVPGEITVSYQTKKATVARSIASVVDEIQKMAREPVARAEVDEQIDAWRNRFVFLFTNESMVVERLMSWELDDRAYDFDRQLLDAVQKVTPADVERVARQYLKPEDLSVCVFGTLTDEDRAALSAKYDLKVLPKDEVFRGGFDRAPAASAGNRSPVVE